MKYIFTILCLTLAFAGKADEVKATVPTDPDTLIIKFGNNSRIMILVNDPNDLKQLQDYDLNSMLRDISLAVDSTENVEYLKIEDASGTRYLSDTTIIIAEEDDYSIEVDVDKNDIEYDDDGEIRSVNIRIRNMSVTMNNMDDWDQIEDDFEDFKMEDLKKEYYDKDRKPGTHFTFNVDFGLNNWIGDDGFPSSSELYGVKGWGSWYIALKGNLNSPIAGPLFVDWGAFFDWYNFKLENRNVQITEGEQMVEFTEFPDLNATKSKLTVSYVNAHFVPMLDFSRGKKKVQSYRNGSMIIKRYKRRGFRIGAGMYAGYRLGSHSKFVVRQNGGKDKEHIKKGFYINNFRYGVRGQIGIRGVDLFVNYDLQPLFEDGRGPEELNPISFGITF